MDAQLANDEETLRELQAWWRNMSDEQFMRGGLCARGRAWPEGYPGDYHTLEGVYQRTPWSHDPLGFIIDRYFLSRTLAIAVRSRLRTLTRVLNERAKIEAVPANWLNLACGPARELVSIPSQKGRTVWCVDTDEHALEYAKELIQPDRRAGETINFVQENAFRFVKPHRTIERYGKFTTIYSTGLFDYIETDKLIRLLAGLYGALDDGGLLVATFKDKECYDTFDYHWFTNWDAFYQRSQAEFDDILARAGMPANEIKLQYDDTGVICFYLITKPARDSQRAVESPPPV